MTTTTDRLSAIEAREQAATKGPWRPFWAYRDPHRLDRGTLIAATAPGHQVRTDVGGGTMPSADLDFIAAARSDIPYLLALARRQQAALTALTEALERVVNHHSDAPYSPQDTAEQALAEAARIVEYDKPEWCTCSKHHECEGHRA